MLVLKIAIVFKYVKCNSRNYLPQGSTKVFHNFSAAVLLQNLFFHYKLLVSFFLSSI